MAEGTKKRKTRVDHLREAWAAKVERIARKRELISLPDGETVFDRLLTIDPTSGKRYSAFVMRAYHDGRFLIEDGDRINETLTKFHAQKGRMPVEARDIARYGDEAELWAAMSRHGLGTDVASGKDKKRADRDRAMLETRITHDGGWVMAELLTHFSACWWGMGTRWCTAARQARTFDHYNNLGPLRVFVSPDGGKTQFHLATGSLCDVADKPVDYGLVLGRDDFPESFVEAVRSDVVSLSKNVANVGRTTHAFQHGLMNSLTRLPARFAGKGVGDLLKPLADAALQSLYQAEEIEGWRVLRPNTEILKWALSLAATDCSRLDGRVRLAMVMPDGTKAFVGSEAEAVEMLAGVANDAPPSLLRKLVDDLVPAWQAKDRRYGLALDKLFNSVPAGALGDTPWAAWAKRLSGHDIDMINQKRPQDCFGTIPDHAFTENVAREFAKKGLRYRIPERMLTRQLVKDLCGAHPYLVNDPVLSPFLMESDLVDVAAAHPNGNNLIKLPREFLTLSLVLQVVRRHSATMKTAIPLIESGAVIMAGATTENAVHDCVMAALAADANALPFVTVPLSREAYLGAMRSGGDGLLKWVPIEYRDEEMCLAAMSRGTWGGLCHFPAWVVRKLAEGDDDKVRAKVAHYRPSMAYSQRLLEAVAVIDPPSHLHTCDAPSAKQAADLVKARLKLEAAEQALAAAA